MGAIAAAYPLLTTAAVSAAGSLAVSSLTKQKDAGAAPAPTVTPVTPMPDEKAVARAAQRTSIAEQARRRGRASTILTQAIADPGDTLGA